MYLETQLRFAHIFSNLNRGDIIKSQVCGCFYCLQIFDAKAVVKWIEGDTALCPFCGIDAIIGSESGFDISFDFLEHMNKMWFGVN